MQNIEAVLQKALLNQLSGTMFKGTHMMQQDLTIASPQDLPSADIQHRDLRESDPAETEGQRCKLI